MPKIILTGNGAVLQELPLLKERVTIGRRPLNDIVIHDLAISGEHAVIVTFFNDSILEDLNSTNGTQVNGQPVKKHFLQHGDVIELGQHRLNYVAEARQPTEAAARSEDSADQPIGYPQPQVSVLRQPAVIRIMDGPNAGKLVVLAKALTTIGRSGGQVAVIAAGTDGYSIAHVEGADYPTLNGAPIGPDARSLAHGDVIEMAGTRIAFSMG